MSYRRVFLIVLDGVGIGGAPDATEFGDEGSDTLGHVLAASGVQLPTMTRLGLGNILIERAGGLLPTSSPQAFCCRLTEVSRGKDTTTGHWEMMGIVRQHGSPTFPGGFPAELLESIEAEARCELIGNEVASGTEIIQRLGPLHVATKAPIVYTSADSVLQLAAHEEVVPLAELYRICEAARTVCSGPWAVDRVIARPFTGNEAGGFTRTENRRDFSLLPPEPTVLDQLTEIGFDVIGVGKIGDIFARQGITESRPVHGNARLMQETTQLAGEDWNGIAFVNLVDFDMLFGHRNDPVGFGAALVDFDTWLATFLPLLLPDDLLLITADHGNDPTTSSTDHSREQVPLIAFSPTLRVPPAAPVVPTGLFHIGYTVAAALGEPLARPGVDLLAGT